MSSEKIETKETYTEPPEELKKLGVTKIGHKVEVELKSAASGVKLCTKQKTLFHGEKGVEETEGEASCATIPTELIEAAKELIGQIPAGPQ